MSTIDEIKKIRIQKKENIEKAGFSAYPAKVNRTHCIKEVLENFDKLAEPAQNIVLVGRIRSLREHGGSSFLNFEDGAGSIQAYFKKDILGEKKYNFFLENFDVGDFIEIKGDLFITKKGEKTIKAQNFAMLAKSLSPLPEKWYGLKDVEERLRKRYLDILFNPEIKEMIEKKAIFWNAAREFHIKNGFLEVETPILENTVGGADADPFVTRHNALDMDVYLRISAGELWQKRLMVAGFEKTFEIGRIFRNEGMSAEHLQDYVQCEAYWAYSDYEDMRAFIRDCYCFVAEKTFNTLKFKIRGFEIDLGKKWEEYDYQEQVKKYTNIDILNTDLKEIKKKTKELGIEIDENFNLARGIDSLWKFCRKKIAGPGFLINHPIVVSPLAKRKQDNPELSQRFQVIIAGSEIGNGYSELNDPIDQKQRFEIQQKLRDAGDEEAQMMDSEYIQAMEYGMPPTSGHGFSERLFSFLMDKPIRECQIFPLMKPKN
ncbi:MAG: lysine--tRNA ligase [Patescibacteria group bacterium]|nr:lysine--tRNA ligase [Patescibacteria group bacterium]